MELRPLYSIGHGTRPLEVFIGLLKEHGIEYLIDVRSKPFSRFNPQYNRRALEQSLEEAGIRYVFMGDTLGGRPEDPACYTADGRADYGMMRTKDFFLTGIERLLAAHRKNCLVAMMCSESKPGECHRTKLIGWVLAEVHVPVMHIDESGKLKTQATVTQEMTKGLAEKDLFGNNTMGTSLKSYGP